MTGSVAHIWGLCILSVTGPLPLESLFCCVFMYVCVYGSSGGCVGKGEQEVRELLQEGESELLIKKKKKGGWEEAKGAE